VPECQHCLTQTRRGAFCSRECREDHERLWGDIDPDELDGFTADDEGEDEV
jgi:hypothetical protein